MGGTKQIRVSEERWEQLKEMKRSSQTYDELIQELIWNTNRKDLADRFEEMDTMDPNEFTPLTDQ